ncbi:MAG: hypothetical protein ABI986_11660, partial [Chloroflexota bacterium]
VRARQHARPQQVLRVLERNPHWHRPRGGIELLSEVGDLSLDYEITVSPLFMRENEWETNKFALLRNIKSEGVAL